MLRRLSLTVLSGVLLALSFPEPHWGWLAWVALVPLLVVALDAGPAAAFGWGFLQGVVFYSFTLEWLYGFFRSYGRMLVWQAAGVLGLMVVILSLFTGGYALGTRLLKRSGVGWALAISPFFWTAFELGRTLMPVIGFPWNLLGYSMSSNLGLVQVVTFGGIYALSFIVAGYNALLVWAWQAGRQRRKQPVVVWAAVSAAILLVAAIGPHVVPKPAGRYTAHLIQLDIQPRVSFPADWEQRNASMLHAVTSLSVNAGKSAPGLVIWPEAPAPFSLQDPNFAARARRIAREGDSDFLVGVDRWRFPPGRAAEASNSAEIVDPAGQTVFRYDKMHLVPFGEYVPWRKYLHFAHDLIGGIGDFTPGKVRAVGRLPGGRFSVFICYEAIFPDEVRQFADRGAQLLINISDDGWYGHTEALEQHLNMARVRAVENRRWLLRDTNTGITAEIDPYGRIRARLPAETRAALTVRYDFRSDRTLYTRWGDWWPELAVVVSCLALAWNFARRKSPVPVG